MGAQACRVCHEEQYQDWLATPHADAFEMLSPEAKTDPACIGCHSTGISEGFQGVQCESCHGAGTDYWPGYVMRDPFLARALGMTDATNPQTCGRCHTSDTPSVRGFDLQRDLHKVNHSSRAKSK